MNLKELKEAVDSAIERARECGESPEEIVVTLQLDIGARDPVWSAEDVELHYDGNLDASGCVLTACVDAP